MSDFNISHAIALFSQEKTTITSLWTVYMIATFAAAGYGLAGTPLNCSTALAVTIGFLAFAVGHWQLLSQSLAVSETLKTEIRGALTSEPNSQFKSSIEVLVGKTSPLWYALATHLFIDTCCFAALWTRVVGGVVCFRN